MALFKKSLTINELTELSLALCENRYNNISQYLKPRTFKQFVKKIIVAIVY